MKQMLEFLAMWFLVMLAAWLALLAFAWIIRWGLT
jgi:hypothetical protein